MPNDDAQDVALRTALDHCRAEYGELVATWRDLERKAQGTTAISGLFLGALLANIHSFENAGPATFMMCVGAVLTVTLSIVSAVRVLLPRDAVAVEDSGAVVEDTLAVLQAVSQGHAQALVREQILARARYWAELNVDVYNHNNEKAGLLEAAHYLLLVSTLLAVATFAVAYFARIAGAIPG